MSGTPTRAGTYTFAVTVTDDNGVISAFNDAVAHLIRVAGIPVSASGGSRLTHSVTVA